MMRRAGRVIGTAQGVAVLRAEDRDPPDIGDRVVDERLDRVGRIVDVFGPVERPYLAVSPEDGIELDALLSQMLYIRGSSDGR